MKNRDLGLELENLLRFKLPWAVRATKSKCVAIESIFGNFADCAREVQNSCPEEFNIFFVEFERRINEIAKWRAPHGCSVHETGNGEIYPNGMPRCKLYCD